MGATEPARLRAEHRALREGSLRWVLTQDDAVGYVRETTDEALLVVVARAALGRCRAAPRRTWRRGCDALRQRGPHGHRARRRDERRRAGRRTGGLGWRLR